MTGLPGNDFMLSVLRGFSCVLGIYDHPYRALSFMLFPASGNSPTRSYFPTVQDSLLPETAIENSWARANGFPATGYKARNPVRAVGQPNELFILAVCNQTTF
jgi:hypothetical protein